MYESGELAHVLGLDAAEVVPLETPEPAQNGAAPIQIENRLG